MHNWRFLVVRHYGGPSQRERACVQIKQQVESHGLSNVLPLVKYELGRQREFYLGLAVDTNALVDGNDTVEIARHVLFDAGIDDAANLQRSWLVEAAEVRKLLSGTVGCESFTVPMRYEATIHGESAPTDRLLSELDISDLRPSAPNIDETEQYSRLLYWCSAIGSGGLDRIRDACQVLGINNDWGGAWSVLRRLVLLGHLEFDGGDTFRWGVIPPTLVTSVEDSTQRILVGQRTPAIVKYLSDHLHVEESPQHNGPPRLLVRGETNELYFGPGRQVRDVGCVAERLRRLLPRVDDWVRCLPTWEERDFGRFSTEQYDPQADEFCQVPAISGSYRAGLYRFTYEQSFRRLVTLALFDDYDSRWICGDYYGLLFLVRRRSSLCRAIYYGDAHQLIIPATDRWPMPYERALVLARGSLPQRVPTESGTFALIYEGIPPEFAAGMCELLGLDMERI